MPHWIDAHNHLQDPRLVDRDSITHSMRDAGIECCIVNATREDDWQEVASLAEKHPDLIVPAFGIHPWQAHTVRPGWQERLTALVKKYPQASIGECGLDCWINTPTLEIQIPIFVDQLRIAHELKRCASIHCLRAWEPLFDAFKHQAPPEKFLLHSFNGSIETARRLIPLGAYFSFSGYFLKPEKSRMIEVFRRLPSERILLETDAPDMTPPAPFITHPLTENLNHPGNLASIGIALAAALDKSPESLAETTRSNTQACFGL